MALAAPAPATVASAAAAISVACAVASVAVYAYNASHLGARVRFFYADNLVVGILFPLVGAFLVRRRPGNAVGWLLTATSVLGVNALANQYAVTGLVVAPGTLPGARAAAWVATWGWTPELIVPAFLPLLFPDGTLPSPRWRPFARVAAAASGCWWWRPCSRRWAPTPITRSATRSRWGRCSTLSCWSWWR